MPQKIPPREGQESVWDYPRPPRLERTGKPVRVVFAGVTIAESQAALRILETSHPPVYYIPPHDVRSEHLAPAAGRSFCEWKGEARYYDVRVAARIAERAAWSYPDPVVEYAALRDHIAFYAHLMDACYVDGERVRPQPGGVYGGWITSDIAGPFKGEPGSAGW
ncbi:MAG: DUF427 domain-containing protein [Candidatus Eisenbacteria bacterium]|nr:DUF427 domain-containing protein [Candidatus Eisenbacteria bacterium]